MLVREKGWFWIASSKIDHVLLCECDHRADELIGSKAGKLGTVLATIDRVCGRNNKNSSLFGLLFCTAADTV